MFPFKQRIRHKEELEFGMRFFTETMVIMHRLWGRVKGGVLVFQSHLLALFMWQSIKFLTANKQMKLGVQRAPYVHRLCQHKQNYTFQHVIQLTCTYFYLCINILTGVSKSLGRESSSQALRKGINTSLIFPKVSKPNRRAPHKMTPTHHSLSYL